MPNHVLDVVEALVLTIFIFGSFVTALTTIGASVAASKGRAMRTWFKARLGEMGLNQVFVELDSSVTRFSTDPVGIALDTWPDEIGVERFKEAVRLSTVPASDGKQDRLQSITDGVLQFELENTATGINLPRQITPPPPAAAGVAVPEGESTVVAPPPGPSNQIATGWTDWRRAALVTKKPVLDDDVLEKWFDYQIADLSAQYERWAKTVSVVLAFFVALLFNVNVIWLAESFNNNANLESNLQTALQSCQLPTTTTTSTTPSSSSSTTATSTSTTVALPTSTTIAITLAPTTTVPTGAPARLRGDAASVVATTAASTPANGTVPPDTTASTTTTTAKPGPLTGDCSRNVEKMQADLTAAGATPGGSGWASYRIGWFKWNRDSWQGLGDILAGFFGFILAWGVISKGGPFWYDILQKVAAARAGQANKKTDSTAGD